MIVTKLATAMLSTANAHKQAVRGSFWANRPATLSKLGFASAAAVLLVWAVLKIPRRDPNDGADQGGVEPNGAWILDPENPQSGHFLDPHLCFALEALFEGKDVLDMGAGLGGYGQCFLRIGNNRTSEAFSSNRKSHLVADEKLERHFLQSMSPLDFWWRNTPKKVRSWSGFDGSRNLENLTSGLVGYFDLTEPRFLGRKFDWVMSLEVGEHIPPEREAVFVQNLVNHVKGGPGTGLVLSWAVRGQAGRQHVNNLDNDEVEGRLRLSGFTPDPKTRDFLRRHASLPWFRDTIMVFRREFDFRAVSSTFP